MNESSADVTTVSAVFTDEEKAKRVFKSRKNNTYSSYDMEEFESDIMDA
jgi:hypothetical protein